MAVHLLPRQKFLLALLSPRMNILDTILLTDTQHFAATTGLVLAPGAIAARAAGVRTTSATLAWGLGIVLGAMTIVFLVHASLTLALVLLLVAALVATPLARRRPVLPEVPGRAGVWCAGAVLGCFSGTSRARSAVTASFTSHGSASSSSSGTSTSRP